MFLTALVVKSYLHTAPGVGLSGRGGIYGESLIPLVPSKGPALLLAEIYKTLVLGSITPLWARNALLSPAIDFPAR